MSAATPLASFAAMPLTPAATNTPPEGSACPGTSKTAIATPVIEAAIKRHFASSDSGASEGTPPPHSGRPSVHRSGKKRSGRRVVSKGKTRGTRRIRELARNQENVPAGVTPKRHLASSGKRPAPSPWAPSPGSTASQPLAETPVNTGSASGAGGGHATPAAVNAMKMLCGAKLTPQLPGRFLTPSFLAGGSDKRATNQRQPLHGSGSHAVAATPRSFMRALSSKSRAANKSIESRRKADTEMTPRTMVKKFMRSGLRTRDLTADTPATRKRRSIRQAREKKAAEEAAAAQALELTPAQRFVQLVVVVFVFLAAMLVLCHLSAPVREAVQAFLFSGRSSYNPTHTVRFT